MRKIGLVGAASALAFAVSLASPRDARAEDKSNPLSDEDLVTKLNEAGYPVARRTVTKYRKMLNIPSSRQRKDWALTGQAPPPEPIEEAEEPDAAPVA